MKARTINDLHYSWYLNVLLKYHSQCKSLIATCINMIPYNFNHATIASLIFFAV